jgi:hypothetical protein
MMTEPTIAAVATPRDVGRERFTIADAIALVAAAAVGLTLARYHFEQVTSVSQASPLWGYRGWVYRGALLVLPFCAALTWSRLRRPWRPARRLAREPEAVALLATAVCLLAILADEVLSQTLPGPPDTRRYVVIWKPLMNPAIRLASLPGPAVLAAWATQWLGGRWRVRPGWIDRLGFALGMTWVLLFLLNSWLLFHWTP